MTEALASGEEYSQWRLNQTSIFLLYLKIQNFNLAIWFSLLRSVVVNEAYPSFCGKFGNMWGCFSCYSYNLEVVWGTCSPGVWWDARGDAAKHPTEYQTVFLCITQNYLSQNVNDAEVVKAWLKLWMVRETEIKCGLPGGLLKIKCACLSSSLSCCLECGCDVRDWAAILGHKEKGHILRTVKWAGGRILGPWCAFFSSFIIHLFTEC